MTSRIARSTRARPNLSGLGSINNDVHLQFYQGGWNEIILNNNNYIFILNIVWFYLQFLFDQIYSFAINTLMWFAWFVLDTKFARNQKNIRNIGFCYAWPSWLVKMWGGKQAN